MTELKDKVTALFKEATKHNKSNSSGGGCTPSQTIKGNENIQIEGDTINIVTSATPNIKVLPPMNSIGNDPFLKQTITTHFNRLGEEMEKRFGKGAHRVMYENFKRDFGIEHNSWTIIWTWPMECA